jgi:DNA repair protein RecO (recombination protein O)
MICRDEGLVLRGYRMTESSKVVVIYARESGKLRLVAKGARRPKSRFGASLEPITWGTYVFYRRENRELQTLSEGDILHPFDSIKQAYRRMAYASAVCDLLDHMTADEDRNPLLYSVTLDTLRWMETIQAWAIEFPLWYFQLKAASALGYRPHLSGCVRCGNRLSGSRVRFSPHEGGTLCSTCGVGGMVMQRATVDFLEQLQTRRPDRIEIQGLKAHGHTEARHILRAFLNYHIESRRKVKSLDFLDRMLAAEAAPAPYGTGAAEEGVS